MKTLKIPTTRDFTPFCLIIRAEVRYWEDATVNGHVDTDGTLIPLRKDDRWCAIIDLETGDVLGWPAGTEARIDYKVCDAGEYYLEDKDGNRVRYRGDYVPRFLGNGDYLRLNIGLNGHVQGWRYPDLDDEDWKFTS